MFQFQDNNYIMMAANLRQNLINTYDVWYNSWIPTWINETFYDVNDI